MKHFIKFNSWKVTFSNEIFLTVRHVMYYLPDCLAFGCLFLDGFFVGYYCKFASNIYGSLWILNHWYSLVGVGTSLLLGGLWSYKKHLQRQYRFDHFYVIFYGLICFAISGCFMIYENFEIFYYFGFVAHALLFLPSYSYISLRSSSSQGCRPARLALANCLYFTGLCAGFTIFNPFEAILCAWIHMGLTLALIAATMVNEILQHLNIHNYRKSCDIVFDMMNEEQLVFLPVKSIYAFFVGNHDFFITKNRQPLTVASMFLLALERTLIYSQTFLELSWAAASSYIGSGQFLCAPFMLYAVGCAFGTVVLTMRYKAQLTYTLFGLIKITAVGAILGVYSDVLRQQCFYFLCFYYVAMGVYSSVALQGVLECSPFLWTELSLASSVYSLDLLMLEAFQFYQPDADEFWYMLLGIGVGGMILTALGTIVVQLYLPLSSGLMDIRNHLLGVRRHKPVIPQSRIWKSHHFQQHDLQPTDVSFITLPGKRVFQQYPRDEKADALKTCF